MTTVIAVETKRGVIFGSDTQVTSGFQKSQLAAPKFFQKNDYVIGLAGVWEMFSVLKRSELPAVETDDLDAHMREVFLPVANQLENEMLEKFGVPANHPNAPHSSLLVSVRGAVYEVDLNDGQAPWRKGSGYSAIGSGSRYALGSLGGARKLDLKAVEAALLAASRNDIGTSGPFIVKNFNN
jgi:ATP-dependent protease HslVU (ClpYQ) peptidase subunit